MAQLLLMCERHDIGLVIHGDEGRGATPADSGGAWQARPVSGDEDEPQIFIYDNYPGGIGFSEPLFEMHRELLERTRILVARCACETGCPACVGPVGQTGPKAKVVAIALLEGLMTRPGTPA